MALSLSAFQGYLPSPAADMAQFTLGGLPHGHRYEGHQCFAGCEVLRFERRCCKAKLCPLGSWLLALREACSTWGLQRAREMTVEDLRDVIRKRLLTLLPPLTFGSLLEHAPSAVRNTLAEHSCSCVCGREWWCSCLNQDRCRGKGGSSSKGSGLGQATPWSCRSSCQH